jgi:protein arginine N-methyltransferase 1
LKRESRPLVALTGLLRTAARAWRWVRRQALSNPAFRGLGDEVRYGEFTRAEQYSQELLLADPVRMEAYRAAIRRNVKAGDVVVDLGTGTGILAMLAAQQNPKIVHAIDYSNIIGLAERVARANNFTNIAFHHMSGRRFVLDEPADVIVHELIGEALFDEGLVEKTLELKKRVLKASGQILPGRFELFLEPVRVKDEHRVPYLHENRFPGIDFSAAMDWSRDDAAASRDWQLGRRAAMDYFLCDPAPILAFDLNQVTDPDEVPQLVSASRVVRRAGRMDGFCFYFRATFDAEVAFETSPFSPRTDWDNLQLRVPSREYREGETIAYRLNMKDRFDVESWTVELS